MYRGITSAQQFDDRRKQTETVFIPYLYLCYRSTLVSLNSGRKAPTTLFQDEGLNTKTQFQIRSKKHVSEQRVLVWIQLNEINSFIFNSSQFCCMLNKVFMVICFCG
jgi:hypothetical protein